MWITLVTTGEISDSIANEHAPMRKKRVLERDVCCSPNFVLTICDSV